MYKTDKNHKTLINKRFTTPLREFYQEVSAKTINTHKSDIWSDDIPVLPNDAVTGGIAVLYDKLILTPDPVYPNNAFFAMETKGAFVAGTGTYEDGIANNAQVVDFISDRYGEDYEVELFTFDNTPIGKTSDIGWIFDYVTGVLYIDNPGTYSTPYKITVYKYIGGVLSGDSSGQGLNITDKNLVASITTTDGDLACSTAITSIPLTDSGVRVYLNNVRVESGNTSHDYCYFSGDGGVTKRAFGSEQQGDLLYWVGSVAEYELENDDYFTFDYIKG